MSPSWNRVQNITAIVALLVAIIWTIISPGFESLTTLLGAITLLAGLRINQWC